MIEMVPLEIKGKTRAIVCFGPLTQTTGTRAGSFFQVTIDPDMVSEGGRYIRFDQRAGDEIHGWQELLAITICEVLDEEAPVDGVPPITMQTVKE